MSVTVWQWALRWQAELGQTVGRVRVSPTPQSDHAGARGPHSSFCAVLSRPAPFYGRLGIPRTATLMSTQLQSHGDHRTRSSVTTPVQVPVKTSREI